MFVANQIISRTDYQFNIINKYVPDPSIRSWEKGQPYRWGANQEFGQILLENCSKMTIILQNRHTETLFDSL